MNEVYEGNSFSVSVSADRRSWVIWALVDDLTGRRETLTLSQDGMDELRRYFAEFYADDLKREAK